MTSMWLFCIHTARDSQTQQIEPTEAVFASNGVAVCKQIAYFATSDTSFQIKLYGKCLSGKLLFGHVSEYSGGIYKDSMTAQ